MSAGKFTPAANPLSFDHHHDTIQAVGEVLRFMEHAILSDQEQDAVEFDMRPGILSIINVCRSALSAHLPKGDAA
jgi:hypothetical protein